MSNIKDKKVELLAPAGNMEAFFAAVENGADAIYLGGKFFNARINAENFSIEEIERAVKYAHIRNVKVYITLNTLLLEEELNEALLYVSKLYALGIDGLIVQDLGIAKLVKEQIPKLSLHLSTQGSVYNLSGVESAKELGFDRVVLARELSIGEVTKIARAKVCDIEVFVHGALCISYSGQCQMSRSIGSRSGNRGICAQPCRMKYKNEKGEEGYFLSPKDLCTIDWLGEIVEAGVKSLKIEGRMKSPEYVATVVAIYRKYLDMYLENGEYKVLDEDREKLLQVFNRGGFTKGHLLLEKEKDFFSGDLPKHAGVYIGEVIERKNNDIILAKLFKPLTMGDGIEIRNKSLSGNVVTFLQESKGIMEIGDIKGSVRKGDKIYKITSKKLSKEAFKEKKKIPIEMKFSAHINEEPSLEIREGKHEIKVYGKEKVEIAINRPTEEGTIKRQLSKTGDTPFYPLSVELIIDKNIKLPISGINQLRREAIEKLIESKTQLPKKISVKKIKEETLKFPHYEKEKIYKLSIITKGKEDSYLEEHFAEIVNEYEGVLVENLGWIKEFSKENLKVYGGKGLNISNSQAKKALEQIGVIPIDSSPETKKENDELMIIEGFIKGKTLEDGQGRKYQVTNNSDLKKTVIKKSRGK